MIQPGSELTPYTNFRRAHIHHIVTQRWMCENGCLRAFKTHQACNTKLAAIALVDFIVGVHDYVLLYTLALVD